MSRARIALQVAAFAILFLVVMQLPIFLQVAEMRSYALDGETLSLEYSLGSLNDFIASYRFIRVAWTAAPKVIYAALSVFHGAFTLLVCYFGARLLDRTIETWIPSKRARS